MVDSNDQDLDPSTAAEASDSAEETDPEEEARQAWAEFTGKAPDTDGEETSEAKADAGDAAEAEPETDQDESTTDGDPPPESAEGEGESSADATDGAASGEDIWANAPSELRAAFDAEMARARIRADAPLLSEAAE